MALKAANVMTRHVRLLVFAALALAALVYLRDPPWTGRLTSGLRSWEEDPPGTFFRWTNGRATFFVPATASELTLPLRAVFPGPNGGPTTVDVRSDDRWLATIALSDPAVWERPRLPLSSAAGSRRYRRIDLRVNRVVGPYILGVMTGEILVDGEALPR
jgi:hypothetical protein